MAFLREKKNNRKGENNLKSLKGIQNMKNLGTPIGLKIELIYRVLSNYLEQMIINTIIADIDMDGRKPIIPSC